MNDTETVSPAIERACALAVSDYQAHMREALRALAAARLAIDAAPANPEFPAQELHNVAYDAASDVLAVLQRIDNGEV